MRKITLLYIVAVLISFVAVPVFAQSFGDGLQLTKVTSVTELLEKGEVPAEEIDLENPLGFVLAESDARDLTEAAYRFCRHEPGLDTILMGTGSLGHLETNVRSLLCPPLPTPVTERLQRIFAHAISASGS